MAYTCEWRTLKACVTHDKTAGVQEKMAKNYEIQVKVISMMVLLMDGLLSTLRNLLEWRRNYNIKGEQNGKRRGERKKLSQAQKKKNNRTQ